MAIRIYTLINLLAKFSVITANFFLSVCLYFNSELGISCPFRADFGSDGSSVLTHHMADLYFSEIFNVLSSVSCSRVDIYLLASTER